MPRDEYPNKLGERLFLREIRSRRPQINPAPASCNEWDNAFCCFIVPRDILMAGENYEIGWSYFAVHVYLLLCCRCNEIHLLL